MLNHLVQPQNRKRCCVILDIVSDIPITAVLEFLEIFRNSSNFWQETVNVKVNKI